MYEELVKKLRDDNACLSISVLHEAADAIEELQEVANKLLEKYQEEAKCVIWEYSGNFDKSFYFLNEEVKTLKAQINGMPKEE